MRQKPRYQPDDLIGARYQVHEVKMGGMGEVYLCLDLEEIHPYALKTFQQRYQSSALRTAFEQEVATWVALERHPNIVRCHWMQMLDNQPFMCLDWIAGEEGKGTDLRGWLRRGPLDLRLALEITLDVVHGLIHAQEKQPGLVHRDLKPENILVAQGGLAKITDFGLAQIVQEVGLEIGTDITQTEGRQSFMGQKGIVGTPAYMAPEQWLGDAVDERTDIYAVGCILYELLTGVLPFQATTPAMFQEQHLTGYIPELPPPDFPVDLEIALQDCLVKSPDHRFRSLTDLLEDLSDVYQEQFGQEPPSRPAAGEMTAVDYVNRGTTYSNLGQLDKSLVDLNLAIAFDPQSATAYSNRGTTYGDLGQLDKSLTDLSQAIALNLQNASAYYSRGATYGDLGQLDKSLADFNRAIALDPQDAKAYAGIGFVFVKQGKVNEALPYLDKADKLGDPQVRHSVAQIRQVLDQEATPPPDSAQATFEAFQQATSLTAMQKAVAQIPFMVQPDFIAAIEQVIAQEVPPEHRPAFEQRLDWLRETTTDGGKNG